MFIGASREYDMGRTRNSYSKNILFVKRKPYHMAGSPRQRLLAGFLPELSVRIFAPDRLPYVIADSV